MKLTICFIPVVLVVLGLKIQETTGAECRDKYQECVAWSEQDYCTKHAKQMKKACCKTCTDVLEAKIKNTLAVAELKAKLAAAEAAATEKTAPRCLTPTTGGNANGACCVFPFKFNGKTYTACTKDSYTLPWCGTTPDAEKWGICQVATTKPPKVTTKAPPPKVVTKGPPVVTTKLPPSVIQALLYNADTSKPKAKAPCVKTKGGNCCHFPFVYKGQSYSNCITEGYSKPWCGINEYATEWGECEKAVNGGWSTWFPFTECSRSCGKGFKTRTRACDNPPRVGGGASCKGPAQQIRHCYIKPCKGDGNWGAWSTYSECSVKCGMGLQTRTRKCDNPAPALGGRECSGPDKEDKICKKAACAVQKPAPAAGGRTGQTNNKRTVQSPPPAGGVGSGIPKLPSPEELRRLEQSAGDRRGSSQQFSYQTLLREMEEIKRRAQDDRRSIDGTWGNAGIDPPDSATDGVSPPLPSQPKNAGNPVGTWGSYGIDANNPKPYPANNGARPPVSGLGSSGVNPGNPYQSINGVRPPVGGLGGVNPGNPYQSINGVRPPVGGLAGINPGNPYQSINGGAPPLSPLGSTGGRPPLPPLGSTGGAPPLPPLGSAGGRPPLPPLGSTGGRPPYGGLGTAGVNLGNPFQSINGQGPPPPPLGSAGANPLNPYQQSMGGRRPPPPPLGSFGTAGMYPYRPQFMPNFQGAAQRGQGYRRNTYRRKYIPQTN